MLTTGFAWCVSHVCMFLAADKQHLLAVGDAAGTLHILEIPWSLRLPTPNEVTLNTSCIHDSSCPTHMQGCFFKPTCSPLNIASIFWFGVHASVHASGFGLSRP